MSGIESFYNSYPFPQLSDERIEVRAQALRTGPLAGSDGITVIDAGCGTGSFSNAFALAFPNAKVKAINISEASLSYARKQAKRLGTDVEFTHMNLFDIPVDWRADLVVCHGVLHHTGRYRDGMDILMHAVKPGGRLSLSLYHIGRYKVALMRTAIHLATRDFGKRVELAQGWFPKAVEKHVGKEELAGDARLVAIADKFAVPIETYHTYSGQVRLLKRHGFEIERLSSISGRVFQWLSFLPTAVVADLNGLRVGREQFSLIARKPL